MILRKKSKQYESCDEGSHLAVLADIDDLGEKVTPWGGQPQLRFRWFVQQLGKDGKQMSVIATFNNSLNENSNLVQVITDLTGTAPNDGFDTDSLIAINSRIVVKHHRTMAGSIFPKIVAYLPPAKGDPVLQIPAWYRRRMNGNNTPPAASRTSVVSAPPTQQADDPDLPPEPHDLDTDDAGTSFPGDRNAA